MVLNKNTLKFNWDILPRWVNYIAVDYNGLICLYEEKPIKKDKCRYWVKQECEWLLENRTETFINLCFTVDNWDELLFESPRSN